MTITSIGYGDIGASPNNGPSTPSNRCPAAAWPIAGWPARGPPLTDVFVRARPCHVAGLELFICAILMLLAGFAWAEVVAGFVNVVTNLNPELTQFRQTMDELNQFMCDTSR